MRRANNLAMTRAQVPRGRAALRLLAALLFLAPGTAGAQSSETAAARALDWVDSVYVQAGGYVHFRDSDDYRGTPVFGAIEAEHMDSHRVGIALFNNSFDQFSQYFYYGYKWKLPFISQDTHFKLSAGVLHGYKGKYEDKVPLNHNGWSPAIIPSIGWKRDRVGFDVTLLGGAGILFTVGYDIWKR